VGVTRLGNFGNLRLTEKDAQALARATQREFDQLYRRLGQTATETVTPAPAATDSITAVERARWNAAYTHSQSPHKTRLDELNDTLIESPELDDLLMYDGLKWVERTPAYLNPLLFHNELDGLQGGDVDEDEFYHLTTVQISQYDTAYDHSQITAANPHATALYQLSDVTITNEADNDTLQFNGVTWENRASITTESLTIVGLAGAGYIDVISQDDIPPDDPDEGTVRLYANEFHGFTRLWQINESSVDTVIGRDAMVVARNMSLATITKGQIVYVSGSTGNVPNVKLARADSAATLPAVFIALGNVLDGAFGLFMRTGIMSNFDTTGFDEGEPVYVSPTVAGAATKTRPSGSDFVQRVGTVLVGGAGNGSIDVNVSLPILNQETGTNQATWTGSAIVVTTITSTGIVAHTMTSNDGTDGFSSTQSGTGRAGLFTRNVSTATRPVLGVHQAHATGGTQAAMLIRQANAGSVALGINNDGSLTDFNFKVLDTGATTMAELTCTTVTASGAVVLSVAGTATTFALQFTGTTSRTIDFGTTGSADPAVSTRSAGTKIVLRNSLTASFLDVALGVTNAGADMWFSVPGATSVYRWWYSSSGTPVAGMALAAGALTLSAGLTCTTISATAITGSGQLTLNLTGAPTTFALRLNGATSRVIDFGTTGVAAPANSTRSAGTKLLLNDALSGGALDYAIGIDSNVLWFSVPISTDAFKWYYNNAGAQVGMTLTAGALVVATSVNAGALTCTTVAASGAITISVAGTTTTFALNFTGTTSRTITFGGTGNSNPTAAPTVTNRSTGTKIVLFENITATSLDYAVGMQSNGIWFSVAGLTNTFQWFSGDGVSATVLGMSLTGAGALTLTAGLTCTTINGTATTITTLACTTITATGASTFSATSNDGTNLNRFEQLGTGRCIFMTRNVNAATRPLCTLDQAHATGGTQAAFAVRQAATTSIALGVNTDGSLTVFNFTVLGTGKVDTVSTYNVSGTQVVTARKTGWTAMTGTAARTAAATHTAQTISNPPTQTEVQNIDNSLVIASQRLKALIDDLISHGLIGT
jgi:hypothetical protein